MPFGCPLPVREDCDPVTSNSSRPRTNHYTTHARFRTSQRGRKHSVATVRPIQVRSANEHGSQAGTSADRCPRESPFPRRRLARPVPIRLPWVTENVRRSWWKASRNRQQNRTTKRPPPVAEDLGNQERPNTVAACARWPRETARILQPRLASPPWQRNLPRRDEQALPRPDRFRTPWRTSRRQCGSAAAR